MIKKTIIRDYGTHSYEEVYMNSDLYCITCGDREVWHESGEGGLLFRS